MKTEGETNIVIDKLGTGAYTEVRRVLSNNGDEPDAYNNQDGLYGKFFPRGMVGWIDTLEWYGNAENGNTIVFKFYPGPEEALEETVSIAVSAGTGYRWITGNVRVYWPYDSLFIEVDTLDGTDLGYDVSEETAPDAYTNTAGTWYQDDKRAYIRLNVGQAVGNLPVGGTVTVKQIKDDVYTFIKGLEGSTERQLSILWDQLVFTGSDKLYSIAPLMQVASVGGVAPLMAEVDDGAVPRTGGGANYNLMVISKLYGDDGTDWARIASRLAASDSDPDLDGLSLLGVHALLSARKDANTTIGLTASDGTYNPLHVRLTDATNLLDDGGNLRVDLKVDTVGLAKESGGNLDTIQADIALMKADIDAIRIAVQIMDDWDSSDTAKTSPQAHPLGCGTLGDGQASVTTTAAAIGSSTTTKFVTVQADFDNTDDIWVGTSGIAVDGGLCFKPGYSKTYPVNNLNLIYAIAASGTQKLNYNYVN